MIRLALALAAALLASPALADTLVTNINGIQVGGDGKLQHFTGLLIGADGKVRSTLTGPPPPMTFEQTIDGKGRTLLPGLIDAHGHVMALGFAALTLDLTGTTSIEDLQRRLKAYADAHPDYPWIVGRGWNQELWSDKRFPTAADIDAAVAARPVWLGRVDGHAAVANSAAMAAAKVDASTKAPPGGEIRDGLFVDNAQALIEKAVPEPTAAMRDRALAEAQSAMLKVGLVGAADMGTSLENWDALRRAGTAGALKVRIFGYASGVENWRLIHDGTPTGWEFGDRLALIGTKLYADGALGSRGAFLKQPYADKPDTRGLSQINSADLLKAADEVAEGRGQLAVHAIGDAAIAEVIGVFERIGAKYGRYHRPRIEHFQIADPKDIPRLKPAGIIASMQPTHQTSDRTMAEARLGPNRLAGAYAWQSVLKAGARIAFGSDFPVESPNPFPGLAAAVSRQDMSGQPPGGWFPSERVSFAQALSGFTRDAAYAGFAEDRMGGLEPGKWADFILVDRDVSRVDPQALARTEVLETWVAGKKVWERASSASAAAPERGQ
jgi:hypothetical protein